MKDPFKTLVLFLIIFPIKATIPVFVGRGAFPYSVGPNSSIPSKINKNTKDNSEKIEDLASGLEINNNPRNLRSPDVNESKKVTNFSELKKLKQSSNSEITDNTNTSSLINSTRDKSASGNSNKELFTENSCCKISKDQSDITVNKKENSNLARPTFSPIQKIKSLFFPKSKLNSNFSEDSLDKKETSESSEYHKEIKKGKKYKLFSKKNKRDKFKQSNPARNFWDFKSENEKLDKEESQNKYSYIKECNDSSSNKNGNDYSVLINEELDMNHSISKEDKEIENLENEINQDIKEIYQNPPVYKTSECPNNKNISKEDSYETSINFSFDNSESNQNSSTNAPQKYEPRLSIFDKFEEECQRFENVLLKLSEMNFIVDNDSNSNENSNRENLIENENTENKNNQKGILNNNDTGNKGVIKANNKSQINDININESNTKIIKNNGNNSVINTDNASKINDTNTKIISPRYIKNQAQTRQVGNKIPLRKFNPKIINMESGDKASKIESYKNSVENSKDSNKEQVSNPIKEPNLKLTIYNEKLDKVDVIYSYYDIEKLKREGLPDIFEKANLKDEFSANETKNSSNLRVNCDQSFDESILYSKVDKTHPNPIEYQLFEDNIQTDQTLLPNKKKKNSILKRIFKLKSAPKKKLESKSRSKNSFKKIKDNLEQASDLF